MNVYLAGRGLACSLGLTVEQALSALRVGAANAVSQTLPGTLGGNYPYHAIPYKQSDWDARARMLLSRVVDEAGGRRDGVLLVATSSFDIGAVELGGEHSDHAVFSAKVAAWLDWTGPVYVISTACTSSLNALLAAQALLQSGEFAEALVLGMELDNRLTSSGFAALQLLTPTTGKPFGVHRDGLVLGEAVAAVRLSVTEPSIWKMLGGANVVDGSQPTGASVAAVVEMCQQALRSSGLEAGDIDLVKVQAAGSPGNDAVEAQALRQAFGKVPPLISLKAMLGHTMGASGAAEIVLLCASLEQGVWLQYEDEVDEALGLELASHMPAVVERMMATILGFGGSHAAVVLERS